MPKTSLNINFNLTGPYYREIRYLDTGGLVSREDGVGSSLSLQKVRQTTNTPNYRSFRLQYGDEALPMNSFAFTLNKTSHPYGHVVTDFPAQNSRQIDSGCIGWGVGFSPGLLEEKFGVVDNEALMKSLAALKQQKVNLGIAFGERKRTASLVLGTIQRVGTSLRALRSGNFLKAAQIIGVPDAKRPNSKKSGGKSYSLSEITSREWLALQYGWKPLLNDVYGSIEQLNDQRPYRTRVSSSKTVRAELTSVLKCYGVPGYKVQREQYTRKYVYVFRVSHEVLSSLSQVGITNPASVAWEVLPWSFVLDWFLPIGKYLDSWDATTGLTFEKGCATSFYRVSIVARASGAGPYNGGFSTGHAYARFDRVWNWRTPLGGFPTANFPGLSAKLGTERILSALGLIRTGLKLKV